MIFHLGPHKQLKSGASWLLQSLLQFETIDLIDLWLFFKRFQRGACACGS